MTQKVTCKKIQVFRDVTLGRWVRDSQRCEESKRLQFWRSKRTRPHSFSKFKVSKAHLHFKLKALLSLKRQKQQTWGYCVTFHENGILIDMNVRISDFSRAT